MTTAPNDVLELLARAIHAERVELVRVARREGLGPEDAVDCVQDAFVTFLRLAQAGELPVGEAGVPAYLAGIVRNAARNKRRLHHVARPHGSIDAVEPAADEPATDALLARAEDHVRLRACVDLLCGTQRAVVTLRLLDEQRGEDVAESLGISRGYVDVLLHRAKAQLRECMAD
jgi:RNA polymerase sigma-70 factor (ECF subfamily)